ncbi:MAG: hypothetical protein ACT4QC_22515 [Planctomycetaceae bacterium]
MRHVRLVDQGASLSHRRSLVALALMAICGCHNAAAEYDQLQKSRQTAKESLLAQGAQVSVVALPVLGGEAFSVDLSSTKAITDETFELLRQLGGGDKAILEMNLKGTTIKDEQIVQLNDRAVSGAVMKLNLSGTAISDKGLGAITNMPVLQELEVSNTKVTSEGINALLKVRAESPDIQSKKPKIRH